MVTCELNTEFHPKRFSAYNALGKVYLYQQRPLDALKAFKKSLALHSGDDNDAHIILEKMRQKAPPDKRHLFE